MNLESLFIQFGQLKEKIEETKKALSSDQVEVKNQLIAVKVNGLQEILSIRIDYNYLRKLSATEAEQLLSESLKQVFRNSRSLAKERLSQAMGGLPLLDMFNMDLP